MSQSVIINGFGAQVETPKRIFVATTKLNERIPAKNPSDNSVFLWENHSRPRERMDNLSIFLRNQTNEKNKMMVVVRDKIFVNVNGFKSIPWFCEAMKVWSAYKTVLRIKLTLITIRKK